MRFGTSTAWSNAGWSNARAWADAEASTQRTAADERDLQQRFWRKLRRLAARLPFAEDLIAAHYCAFDRQTPLRVKAALVGALAYFVLPADVIPDVLPLIGGARRSHQARRLAHHAGSPRGGAAHIGSHARGASSFTGHLKSFPKTGIHPGSSPRQAFSGSYADHGRSTILPMTLRSAMALSAFAVSANG
jgi:hypothetical protein